MNMLANNLKTSFVPSLLPAMCPCPAQRMQFHQSTSPLNFIGNNVLPGPTTSRIFRNPNFFACGRSDNASASHQQTNLDSDMSPQQSTNDDMSPQHSANDDMSPQQPANDDMSPQQPANDDMLSQHSANDDMLSQHSANDDMLSQQPENDDMSPQQPESDDFQEPVEPSKSRSRKRSRKTKHKKRSRKSPEKHNTNRQVVQELMDVTNDATDNSFESITDEETDDAKPSSSKLGDVLVLPSSSSPLPTIEISPEIPVETTCVSESVSPPPRQRQCSTTESEDSFIVFESGTDEECDFSEGDVGSETSDDDISDSDSPSSVVPTKKVSLFQVRFAEDLCEVHPMVKWSFAYHAARRGPWELYARDRERFKNKIQDVGEQIIYCFEPEHRQKIYDQRFNESMDN